MSEHGVVPPSLLSRPPVPNYIEFTRRQKGQKVEFTTGERIGPRRRGLDLGREWQHLLPAEGEAALAPLAGTQKCTTEYKIPL